MLRGVLLHVVQTTRPVNFAVDCTWWNFGSGVVNYVVGITWSGGIRPSAGVWHINDFYYLGVA
jgi:hypothetical protein